jgi:hypothetical protein
MIESIMYFGIGFLVAALIALAIIPLVHSRAVRLTVRRLEDSIPRSVAEIQADKDALRADFAMSTRRLEITIDELKTKHTNQLAELGKKGDAVNRLQIEREAQNVEVAALKAGVVALNERLIAAGEEIEAVRSRSHTDDLVSLAPNEDRADEEAPTVGLVNDADEAHRRGLVRGRRTIRIGASSNFARLAAVALISAGAAFAWQQYNAEGARSAISSLGWLLSMSTTKLPHADVTVRQADSTLPAVSAHDAEPPQPAPVAQPPSATAISPEPGKVTASLEQSHPVEPDTKRETSSPPLQSGPVTPERKPTSLEGWTLREMTDGKAVLEGPTGIWRVTPGDTVPGMGKVESYIRSNGQWIVATSSGLISMPIRQNTSSSTLQSNTAPARETNAKSIKDWTLREVANGTAVLQGPSGILKVTTGDAVAGLGKVTAIVRWGKGWVVATSAGYCTSAPQQHADGTCKPYSGASH